MQLPKDIEQGVLKALEELCAKDAENPNLYYSEIYMDYSDEIGEDAIRKAAKSEDPRSHLWQVIDDSYQEEEWRVEDETFNEVLQRLSTLGFGGLDVLEDSIREYFQEHHYVQTPAEELFKASVEVNIVLNAGDMNYDFGINTPIVGYHGQSQPKVHPKSGVLWLAKSQGFTLKELTTALNTPEGEVESKFLRSLRSEIENTSVSLPAITFMVRMTILEWLELRDAINRESHLNNVYNPNKSKGRGYVLLSKKTTCGLYCSWEGGGSTLEIELDKDVRLPLHNIHTADPDGAHGYGIESAYLLCKSAWGRDCVLAIRPQKKLPESN